MTETKEPTSLFRLDASIRAEGSVSRAIADIVEGVWREDNPDEVVTRRQIGLDPVPATAWALSVFADRAEPQKQSPEQREAVLLATVLVDELVAADAFLFAIPLYNFGVSQHSKPTWISSPPIRVSAQPAVNHFAVVRRCWQRCVAAPTAKARHVRAGITRRDGIAASWKTCGAWTYAWWRPSSHW